MDNTAFYNYVQNPPGEFTRTFARLTAGIEDASVLMWLRRCTGARRHLWRTDHATHTLVYSAAQRCAAAGLVPAWGPNVYYTRAHIRTVVAHAWAMCQLDGIGLLPMPGSRTLRIVALRGLGKGRKEATDGPVWTAAIAAAGEECAAYFRCLAVHEADEAFSPTWGWDVQQADGDAAPPVATLGVWLQRRASGPLFTPIRLHIVEPDTDWHLALAAQQIVEAEEVGDYDLARLWVDNLVIPIVGGPMAADDDSTAEYGDDDLDPADLPGPRYPLEAPALPGGDIMVHLFAVNGFAARGVTLRADDPRLAELTAWADFRATGACERGLTAWADTVGWDYAAGVPIGQVLAWMRADEDDPVWYRAGVGRDTYRVYATSLLHRRL